MPACCRCNGSGRCTNCCCKKAGRFCINCLPSRKNHCGNQAPSDLNRVYPGRSSSAENRTDTADDLERTPYPPPAVTVFESVDVPTLPTIEDSNEAQIENPIVNPTDMLPPYTPISPIDPSYIQVGERRGLRISSEGGQMLRRSGPLAEKCFQRSFGESRKGLRQ